MKKFLIGIIFIIPVVIIFALNATGRIIKSSTPINARSLSLRDANNQEINANIPLVMDIADEEEIVIIEILPSITEQSIIYEIDELPDKGNLELIRVDATNRYKIIPLESGVARVIVRAKNNRDVYKVFTVLIREKAISDIIIYNEDGGIVTETEITGPARFFADIYPIVALDGNNVVWGSENDDIAYVSPNGTVTPVSPGITRIWVSALDITGNRQTAYLAVDTTKALIKNTILYSSGQVDVQWVYDNAVINKGAQVSYAGGNKYAVSLGGRTAEVTVLPCQTDDWAMEDIPLTLYTNDGPFFLSAKTLNEQNSGTVFPQYSVSDISVARISGSCLVPLTKGTVKLSAAYGGKTKTYTVEIRNKPLFFNLNLNSEDGQLGIMMSRVFAFNWFKPDMTLTNTYQFGAQIHKDDADLLWEVDNQDLAAITEDAKITFTTLSLGKEVKVTATVMRGNYRTKLSRSFVFKILGDGDAVNAYDAKEFYAVNENMKGCPIVLQNNIDITRTAYLSSSVYGNGFMADAKKYDLTRWTCVFFITNENISEETSLMIEDIIIEAASDYVSAPHRGQGIYIERVKKPVIIKNAIIRYMNDGILIDDSTDVLIEGCIIGDSYFTAISYFNPPPAENRLTLKNNIIKETEGPSIIIVNNLFDSAYYNNNIMPYFTVQGFLDIYNWKTADDIKHLMEPMDPGVLAGFGAYVDPQQLFKIIGDALKTIFEREDMRYLAYTEPETGKRYYCPGMLALGAYHTIDSARVTLEDEGLSFLKFNFPYQDGSDIAAMVALLEMMVKIVDRNMTMLHSNYILTYNLTAEGGPRNKPGDPVPQTKELYHRLNGYYAETDSTSAEQ